MMGALLTFRGDFIGEVLGDVKASHDAAITLFEPNCRTRASRFERFLAEKHTPNKMLYIGLSDPN
jgi:hypothetical protein